MWVKAIPYLIAAALVVGALIQVNNWRVDAGKLSQATATIEAMKEEKEKNDKLIKNHESNLSKLRTNAAQNRAKLNRELDSGAGYDCAIDANGVRILREAATKHSR